AAVAAKAAMRHQLSIGDAVARAADRLAGAAQAVAPVIAVATAGGIHALLTARAVAVGTALRRTRHVRLADAVGADVGAVGAIRGARAIAEAGGVDAALAGAALAVKPALRRIGRRPVDAVTAGADLSGAAAGTGAARLLAGAVHAQASRAAFGAVLA